MLWRLPLLPRLLSPAIVTILATFIVANWWPSAVLFVGSGNTAPRAVNPFEYLPMTVALALGVGLAPRLPQYDRYGTEHTRWAAIVSGLATVLVPLALFFAALTLYPADASPPAWFLRPIVNNVLVASFLAVILLGLLGRLIGTMLWAALIYTIWLAQSQTSAQEHLLPFTFGFRPDLTLDTSIRWLWIIGLALVAAAVVWVRRSVPIRVSIRQPEEE